MLQVYMRDALQVHNMWPEAGFNKYFMQLFNSIIAFVYIFSNAMMLFWKLS